VAQRPRRSRPGRRIANVISSSVDRFDLVVIGCGPAGEKGANQAAYFGHRVAVVERRSRPGGAAVAVAGVPVKALRDTAVYLSGWSGGDTHGVRIGLTPDLVMNRLRARVSDVVATMTAAVGENLNRHGVELVHGEARLGPGRTVIVRDEHVGERVLQARVVLLATGSRPHHPQGIPFDDPDVHDSETVLSIERLPEHVVVVGGGPVGCEYASILAALGRQVTLVDRGQRLLRLLDPELSAALAQSLKRAGVRLMLSAHLEAVERHADGLAVRVDGQVLRPDILLHAAGRAGNIEGLGLAEAGVQADDRGRVRVDRNFQTTAQGIYAAGDITGPPGLASVAMEQARIATCRAFEIPFKDTLDPAVSSGIYTLPEAAMVGLTEEEARAASVDVETGRAFFDANARALIAGSSEGLVKLVFRASDRQLLGAHILGEEATELIHIAQAVLHNCGTIDEFIDTTFNFPTRADAYKYAAYDGLQRLRRPRTARFEPAPSDRPRGVRLSRNPGCGGRGASASRATASASKPPRSFDGT
jgi:NAD(P) transhydrogenase